METARTIVVRNVTCSAANSVKPTWNISCASNVQGTKFNAVGAAWNTIRQTRMANSHIPKNPFRAFFATEMTDGDLEKQILF